MLVRVLPLLTAIVLFATTGKSCPTRPLPPSQSADILPFRHVPFAVFADGRFIVFYTDAPPGSLPTVSDLQGFNTVYLGVSSFLQSFRMWLHRGLT